jgi:hypothetical protein
MIVLRALAIWFAVLLLAIVNGGLREELLIPLFGLAPALFLSGLLLCALILLVTHKSIRWLGPRSTQSCWAIGACWMAMTMAFETSFGLLVQHQSLTDLLKPYTFAGGDVWPLVLLTLLAAPRLAFRATDRSA